MTRRRAAALLGALGAVGAVAAGIFLLRDSPPATTPPVAPASSPPPAPPPEPPAPPETSPSVAAAAEDSVPSQPFEASGLDPEDLEYPEGLKGPVVVGRLTAGWDTDPEADVALEAVDDPNREDPSEVETLDRGGYRLRNFKPGVYRVRARALGAVAVYSIPFEARNGFVFDAGLLRLRRPGSLGGAVLSPSGDFADADVRLFGRDPFTLVPSVVEKVRSVGRQGFLLQPHEAGAFRIAAVGEAGYAAVEGRADREGLAWLEVRLQPWGGIEAVPGKDVRILGMTLEALEAPDLGEFGKVRTFDRGGTIERVPAGRYRLAARWTGGAAGTAEREERAEVAVTSGREARLEVPARP